MMNIKDAELINFIKEWKWCCLQKRNSSKIIWKKKNENEWIEEVKRNINDESRGEKMIKVKMKKKWK